MTAIREDLRHAFDAAVAAAHPSRILTQHLPPRPAGQAYVFAVGKAAVPMTIVETMSASSVGCAPNSSTSALSGVLRSRIRPAGCVTTRRLR
ncbi:MAG: DUF4147 domain-containing protein, partial [Alphaproteobacteria bacterium]